jgi:putative sterol carrier protein
MSAIFPSKEWLKKLETKLNADEKHKTIAKNWEGDLFFDIQPQGNLTQPLRFYLDLWHGTCRKAEYNPDESAYPNPAFKWMASYHNLADVLTGKMNPITGMMTGKLKVQGNMGYIMRNTATVLDFVRVAQEVTQEIL